MEVTAAFNVTILFGKDEGRAEFPGHSAVCLARRAFQLMR